MLKSISFKAALVAAVSLLALTSIADTEERIVENAKTGLVDRYPTKVIDRPGEVPVGIIAANINSQMNVNDKVVKLDVGTEFGIMKNLQGQFSYDGVEFNKWQAKSTFNLGAKYKYFGMSHMSNGMSVKLPIHVGKDADGTNHIVRSITFGLPTTFYNHLMAGGILGDVFTVKMRPNVEVAFDFAAWYGMQIYGDLWAQVDTSFGKIALENKNNQGEWVTKGFWKELPAKLTLIYAFNNYFDLGANAGFTDIYKAKDSFTVGLSLGLRAGKIFG